MCLLKVYLDEEASGRKLIAEQVALVTIDKDEIKLMNLEFKEIVLKDVEIVSVDTLNSILLLKR
jgi:hypothetical protein